MLPQMGVKRLVCMYISRRYLNFIQIPSTPLAVQVYAIREFMQYAMRCYDYV